MAMAKAASTPGTINKALAAPMWDEYLRDHACWIYDTYHLICIAMDERGEL